MRGERPFRCHWNNREIETRCASRYATAAEVSAPPLPMSGRGPASVWDCSACKSVWRCWAVGARSRVRWARARGSLPRCRWWRPFRGRKTMESEAPPALARTGRVIIADDHELARLGLRTMLVPEPDLEVVGEAATGREAVELSRK